MVKKSIAATSSKISRISGEITVPGDKSISHRALILSSQAVGKSEIQGLLESEDVIHTADALRHMGIEISKNSKNSWVVNGMGTGGLSEPKDVLYMGNSGTGCRLMMGLVAPYKFTSFFSGDASLRNRPMKRVIEPLKQFGVGFVMHSGEKLPLAVIGALEPVPAEYEVPVPSAQVKSAILLAGLNTPGITTVIEKEPTRDHTELMMQYFGAEVRHENNVIKLTGQPELGSRQVKVPGDPSSAAFLVTAALIVPGSELLIKNICINPLRTGFYETIKEMGADIEFINERMEAGERIADIIVKHSELKGISVPAERAPSMIDEYPVLAIAASFASGTTELNGLAELKVKESNRLEAIFKGLHESGVNAKIGEDSLIIEGNDAVPKGGCQVSTYLDHRIAMSFLVMGMASQEPITVDDISMIDTSFPGFVELANRLGGQIS